MPRLSACGFDVQFIITGERLKPVPEENELLQRFRELSLKGKSSIFMTLDALERLAPNLKDAEGQVAQQLRGIILPKTTEAAIRGLVCF